MELDKLSEHLSAAQIERAALTSDTLHLIGCTACQEKVARLTERLETTPLGQYPTAE